MPHVDFQRGEVLLAVRAVVAGIATGSRILCFVSTCGRGVEKELPVSVVAGIANAIPVAVGLAGIVGTVAVIDTVCRVITITVIREN